MRKCMRKIILYQFTHIHELAYYLCLPLLEFSKNLSHFQRAPVSAQDASFQIQFPCWMSEMPADWIPFKRVSKTPHNDKVLLVYER